ncbi:MAG: acyltransferase family protein, partial [Pseudomonadota bacterium]
FAHAYLNRPTSPWRFAVARVARLYPLHLLTLLLVAGLQAASLAFAGQWQIYGNNDLHHFVLQLFFASNSVSVSHGLSFNGPIWSVSLEILVYAAFFLALWPLRRGGLWAAGAIAALCWGAYLAPVTPPVISKMVLLCAGYFFLGTLVYGAYGGWMRLPWVLALSLAGVVAGAWFEIRGLVEPAAATGLVALLALSGERLEALGQRLTPLGDLSYSLYLIHVPLQIALLLVADLALGGTRSFAETAWLLPVFLAVSMGLAHLTYHGFERPAGRWVKAALLPRRA